MNGGEQNPARLRRHSKTSNIDQDSVAARPGITPGWGTTPLARRLRRGSRRSQPRVRAHRYPGDDAQPGAFRTDFAVRSLVLSRTVTQENAHTARSAAQRAIHLMGCSAATPKRAARVILDNVRGESVPSSYAGTTRPRSFVENCRVASTRSMSDVGSRAPDYQETNSAPSSCRARTPARACCGWRSSHP